MKFEISNKPISTFNFSSLTDIVLLLLIFFLLSSQFVVNTGIKIQLPTSNTNKETLNSDFSITLTKTGEIYIGTKKINELQLVNEISILKKKLKKDNLIIRADKDVVIDKLVRLIDAAKAGGINKFTLETKKKIR